MTKPNKLYDAVVAGYLGVDIMPVLTETEGVSFADRFAPGSLVEANGLHLSLGGVVPNTGLAMKRMGVSVRLMGSVGRDSLGNLALDLLSECNAADGIRQRSDAGTAYGIVIAPPDVDRTFIEDPGCNRVFSADDIDYDVVAKSRLFHFGYPPLMDALWHNNGAELLRLLQRVQETETAVSLDLSLPDPGSPAGQADWQRILEKVLPYVDVFVPSEDELRYMLDPESRMKTATETSESLTSTCGQLAQQALNMGAQTVLVKAGAEGAYLLTGNLNRLKAKLNLSDSAGCPDGVWLPIFPEDPGRRKNASGAGDCAIAGFLTALLRDECIVKAGQYAMMAGRDNLYGADALSGIRTWDEMSNEMKGQNNEIN